MARSLRRWSAASGRERHAGKAVHYSKLSAQQAEAQSAFAEAAAQYDNCLTVLSTADGASPEEEAPLLVAHGVAARNAGDNRAGYRSLMRAIDLYRGQDDPSGLGSATIEALGMFCRRIGRWSCCGGLWPPAIGWSRALRRGCT
ncbi:MAG TPA: hypothetical protein QGF05_02630 [Dehalococcoidia bacterium]|nr:hypothetical protein [Dehalococcoidia bacterium]